MIGSPARATTGRIVDPLEPIVVGVDHNAPLRLRERVAAAAPAFQSWIAGRASESVLLSTCNRVELYLAGASDSVDDLVVDLGHAAGLSADELAEWLWTRSGADAAAHLFDVATGLESQLLGESEILRQVRLAHRIAGSQGPVLSALFRYALAVGKRARAQTAIARGAASIGSAAAAIVRAELPAAARRHAVVVGAGDAARRVLAHLRPLGFQRVDVVNRTVARAEALMGDRTPLEDAHSLALSQRERGRALGLDALPSLLGGADVVICATTAPDALIPLAVAGPAVMLRRAPILLLDLSVPRNVEPSVDELPMVRLYDVDAVQGRASASVDQRREAVADVRALTDDFLVAFARWQVARRAAPAIRALRRAAEERRQEVLSRLPTDLDEAERLAIHRRTRAEMRAMLHAPTVALRTGG